MFGYVKAFKPQMKICEFELYRGVYCSLCNALGKRYGVGARFTLSYDFTFLALFLMGIGSDDVLFKEGRCPFNPTKKRMYCHGDGASAIEYAADVAMLLTYHKLCDTVSDERFWKRLSARWMRVFVKRDYKKAVKRRPNEAQAAQEYMSAQRLVETEKFDSIDRAAEPTAILLRMLASGFVELEDSVRETVERFGYCLGRYIYLADAADDLVEDLKSGNYNPYALAYKDLIESETSEAIHGRMEQSLHACVAVCAECYEDLKIKRFDGILRNVIYYGMPSEIKRIRRGKQEGKSNEKSV